MNSDVFEFTLNPDEDVSVDIRNYFPDCKVEFFLARIKKCGCVVPYSKRFMYEFRKKSRKIKPEKHGRGISRRNKNEYS